MGKHKDQRWVRSTEELIEILDDEVGFKESGNWDNLHTSLYDDKPVEECPAEFYLTEYMMHDDVTYLVFNTGHVERLTHPDGGDFAHDGDYWYVGALGWA